MSSNREISRQFSLYAELLLLHDKDQKLAAILSGASFRIRRMSENVTALTGKQLTNLFKPEVVNIIEVIKKKNAIPALDELVQLTPGGLFDMMRIKGLGGKKLSALWKTAGIDTIDMLLEACRENKLSSIPGFGIKTQQNIIAAIELINSSTDRFHYATVADAAVALELKMQKAFKTKLFSLCGEIRRKNTTVPGIEMLTIVTPEKLLLSSPRTHVIIQSSSKESSKGHTVDEIPVTIYHTSKTNFYNDLFTRTGSEAHVQKVLSKQKKETRSGSEEEIYNAAGLPFILPELREDVAEWDKLTGDLLTVNDIKGVVHNHTTWSDGIDSLEDFVKACIRKGYEYTVISDHSKNAHYAGGLKEDQVLRQFETIDKLNKKVSPFRVFKSIECDILVSGELDYTHDLRKQFDLVIISIHQLLKMDEQKATNRLIKAIEDPQTTILGHMTGRQLLIRPGYPVNFKKVIDACAANKVVIEINANPYRLDMDWTHIPYALNKGVMISVNPDAHSIHEIDNIRWGVEAARKGGLTKNKTWNALDLKGIVKWLKVKNSSFK